jgi:plasmid stabilization system protein ParE
VPRVVVRIAESALADLESLRAWYAEQGAPAAGEQLVADVFASIESLVDHTEMGRVVPEFGAPALRELIRPPVRVVYRVDPGYVRVVRVWRSERRLRLPKGVKPSG